MSTGCQTENISDPLKKWMRTHADVSVFLTIYRNTPQSSPSSVPFSVRRQAVHNRTLNSLMEYGDSLEKVKKKCVNLITGIAESPVMKVSPIFFDNSQNIFLLRQYVFLNRKSVSCQLKAINSHLNIVITKLEATKTIESLLSSQFLPYDAIVRVIDSFFEDFTKIIPQNVSDRLLRITSNMNALHQTIAALPYPKWVTDFPGFFKEILQKAMEHFDEKLSYYPPLAFEQPLSHYIFSFSPQIAHLIDEVVNLIDTVSSSEFVDRVISLCCDLVPMAETLSPTEQSAALLMFFRVIFDRTYERKYRSLFKPASDGRGIITSLAELPMSQFNIPPAFSKSSRPEETIRHFFFNEKFIHSASLFLDDTAFVTNPIDSLFLVHKSLLCIQKASLMREFVGSEAKLEDLHQLLCFDDLFSLLLGVLLACDHPDFLTFSDFLDNYSPKSRMSNSFEYAQAAVTSLSLYCRKTAPQILQKYNQSICKTEKSS